MKAGPYDIRVDDLRGPAIRALLQEHLAMAAANSTPDKIFKSLAQNEHIAPEPRRATLRYFATDSLAIETFAYIMTADFDESLRIRNDLMLDIYERLEQAGIGFAFPTQTLYLRKDETGQG